MSWSELVISVHVTLFLKYCSKTDKRLRKKKSQRQNQENRGTYRRILLKMKECILKILMGNICLSLVIQYKVHTLSSDCLLKQWLQHWLIDPNPSLCGSWGSLTSSQWKLTTKNKGFIRRKCFYSCISDEKKPVETCKTRGDVIIRGPVLRIF